MSRSKTETVAAIAVGGVVACCGISAVLIALVGATLLGIAVEAWVGAAAAVIVLVVVTTHLVLSRRP